MKIKELKIAFPKKTVIIQCNVRKKKYLLSFATKLIEKIPDPTNTKKNCQSYLKKKIDERIKQKLLNNKRL